MSRSKKVFIAGVSIILVLVVLLGCLPGKQKPVSFNCAPLSKLQSMLPGARKAGQTPASTTGPTRTHPPVRTGDITTGPKAQVAAGTIDASGGTIEVSKPGDPMDGFVIDVPPQAYTDGRTFKVSSAPITKQTFGSDINPVSPLITVDNGGGYSEEPLYIRVPVKVPEDSFAMGFLYDEKSRQLEGVPLIGIDAESVTIATRHFSSFFISMLKKAMLKKDIDSGFRPGIDDWQFPNAGSYISSGGHCEGQSTSAMWYYCTQPDGKDMCLYGRYDNNGNTPATPALWQDDSLGYRFCSVVQEEDRAFKDTTFEDFWDNLGGVGWKQVNNGWQRYDVPGIGDEATYNLFAYSILATGEPQEVIIRSKAGGGHSMIVYKIVGNALYIADPNYPGNTDRKIIFYADDGKFKPYNSGANKKDIDAGKGKAYEIIMYAAKSAVVPWNKIAQRWGEFKAATIGNTKFPGYDLNVFDDKGNKTPLTDGFITDKKNLKVGVFSPVLGNNNIGIIAYRDGVKLPGDNNGAIELNPGNNLMGYYVLGKINNDWEYIDFKYYNVKYEGECKTPPPANILAKLQKTTTFKCELLNLPSYIEGHGSMNLWVPGFRWQKHFYIPGNAIKKGPMKITWSGTSFSGGGTDEYPDKLTGNVCYSDGKVQVSFDYATNDPVDNLKMSVKKLPCDPKYFMDSRYATDGKSRLQYMSTEAPVVKTYVTRLEWTSHEERTNFGESQPEVWDAVFTAPDWTKQCGFMLDFE